MSSILKKKIAILNQDSGYLMIDIANAYADEGYNVSVIAGRIVKRNHDLRKGIKQIKTIVYNRKSTFQRLYTWIFASLQMLFIVWFRLRKHELLIVSNPPFASLLPFFFCNKFNLLVYDIYPDNLFELNILSRNSLVVKLWQKANRKVFSRANRIITITEGMKEVIQKYVKNKNVELISIWTDNDFLVPIPKNGNPFLTMHNLQNKFVVMYSGNIGISNDIEKLLKIAKKIKREDIIMVIVGEGSRKSYIESLIKSDSIANCIILPWQEVSMLPFSLSASDLSVIILGKNISKLALPSKLYSLLSVGSPILCISSQDSDLSSFIMTHDIGKSFNHEMEDQIVDYIYYIADNPLIKNKLCLNSLAASKNFTATNAKKFINA